MMLRSSSTPVLGSLLPSISPESPNNHHHYHHDTTLHPYKFSFHQTPSHGSQHFTTLSSCNGGLRRAQSAGNLERLMSSGGGGGGNDDAFGFFNPPKKLSSRLHCFLLETIPSFSYHNSRFESDGDESSDDEEREEEDGFCEFRGVNIENKVLRLNKGLGFGNLEIKDDVGDAGSQMYLAEGIGVDAGFDCGDGGGGGAGSGGGGRNLSRLGSGEEGGGGGGDNHEVEEHYRKMVNESPGNPLLLGNYARFLYESKQDLQGAEEYYSRAIIIDPNDGETLSQYAKLLWELHRDKERATNYFERAVHLASEDSHVHAAYASFLWETEEEEDEDEEGYYSNIPPLFNNATMASTATA